MATHSDKPPLLRTLLILGRVSNLPTVWSNCLAGWLLAGGGAWSRFAVLCGGASLLYIGGMFLNDACDVRFDTAHRQERPIPSGAIAVRSVWLLAGLLLFAGTSLLASFGLTSTFIAVSLLTCIVLYDLVHKLVPFAPLLMAGCRFLLYLSAASVAREGVTDLAILCGASLALYIVGLSYIARKESQQVKPNMVAVPFLAVPLLSGCLLSTFQNALIVGLLLIAFAGWGIFWMRHMIKGGAPAIGRTVSALLAGIVLVDMLAVQGGGGVMPLAFLALFASALILQRTIPAT